MKKLEYRILNILGCLWLLCFGLYLSGYVPVEWTAFIEPKVVALVKNNPSAYTLLLVAWLLLMAWSIRLTYTGWGGILSRIVKLESEKQK